jgi:hypothetical protein
VLASVWLLGMQRCNKSPKRTCPTSLRWGNMQYTFSQIGKGTFEQVS